MERYPEVIEAGRGADAPYAARYEHVLTLTEPEGLLVMYGEYHNLARDGIRAVGVKRHVEIPLPPRFVTTELGE